LRQFTRLRQLAAPMVTGVCVPVGDDTPCLHTESVVAALGAEAVFSLGSERDRFSRVRVQGEARPGQVNLLLAPLRAVEQWATHHRPA
jgi:hypothetical protein